MQDKCVNNAMIVRKMFGLQTGRSLLDRVPNVAFFASAIELPNFSVCANTFPSIPVLFHRRPCFPLPFPRYQSLTLPTPRSRSTILVLPRRIQSFLVTNSLIVLAIVSFPKGYRYMTCANLSSWCSSWWRMINSSTLDLRLHQSVLAHCEMSTSTLLGMVSRSNGCE